MTVLRRLRLYGIAEFRQPVASRTLQRGTKETLMISLRIRSSEDS
jgi:hypothetical protein